VDIERRHDDLLASGPVTAIRLMQAAPEHPRRVALATLQNVPPCVVRLAIVQLNGREEGVAGRTVEVITSARVMYRKVAITCCGVSARTSQASLKS